MLLFDLIFSVDYKNGLNITSKAHIPVDQKKKRKDNFFDDGQ